MIKPVIVRLDECLLHVDTRVKLNRSNYAALAAAMPYIKKACRDEGYTRLHGKVYGAEFSVAEFSVAELGVVAYYQPVPRDLIWKKFELPYTSRRPEDILRRRFRDG